MYFLLRWQRLIAFKYPFLLFLKPLIFRWTKATQNKTKFPSTLSARSGHMTKFWPME